jgi:hypothetical protein
MLRIAQKISIGKPEGKRQLGRHRHRGDDTNRMYLREIGWEGVGCIYLVQDKDQWQVLVKTLMNVWVPEKAWSFFTGWVTFSLSGRTLLHGVSLCVCVCVL